jgi:hypothetical protein
MPGKDISVAAPMTAAYSSRLSHENLGRMFGVGSVELFMHNLQNETFDEEFVPEGAPAGTPTDTG